MTIPCPEARADLVDLDRGELDSGRRAAIEAHVAACPACAKALRGIHGARTLVLRVTSIEPEPVRSARMRSVLTEALRAERVATGETAGSASVPDTPWSWLRARYERSASFRRVTIASIGLHAAAAVLFAVVLAQRGTGMSERNPVIGAGMDPAGAGLPSELADAAGFPRFEAADAAGVRDSRGRSFPNRATAARMSTVLDRDSFRAELRTQLGGDAEASAALGSIGRGLAWISSQRTAQGAFGGFERPDDAAWALLANASAGRSSDDDAQMTAAVLALESVGSEHGVSVQAKSVQALVRQYAVDFDRLAPAERSGRAARIAASADRLVRSQREDGSFGGAASERAGESRGGPIATTVAAAVALRDVRAIGAADTAAALVCAQAWLGERRAQDGLLRGAIGDEHLALTSALLDVEASLDRLSARPEYAARIAARTIQSRSPVEAEAGVAALRAIGRPVADPVRGIVSAQLPDGRWDPWSAGARESSGSQVQATAAAVVSVTRAAW